MQEVVPSEHQEQCALIRWFDAQYAHTGFVLFAVPNGGARNIVTGRKLKAEGVRSGVPDLFLAVPRGEYHGLFIEMKRRKGGAVSKEQKAMIAKLEAQGYKCVVCKGAGEALSCITSYLTDNE